MARSSPSRRPGRLSKSSKSRKRRLRQAVAPLFVVIGAPLLTENLGGEQLWLQILVAAVVFAGCVALWAFFGGWLLKRVDNFNPKASELDLLKINCYIGSIDIKPDRAMDPVYLLIDEGQASRFSDPETAKEFSSMPPELTRDGNGERYWPAALGTVRLLVRHQRAKRPGAPLALKRVRLLWTADLDGEVRVRAERYVRSALHRIEPSIEVDFTSDGSTALTSPERLITLYETATLELKRQLDQDANDGYIGIDATAGTVLHSLAGAKAADDLDARLIYNVARAVSDHESFLLCVDV